MDLGIAGLRVLVTAGAAGIGRGIVDAFQEEGARVFACDIDADALNGLPDAVGRTRTDVADRDAVAAMMDQAVDFLGGLDVLVNNAGTSGTTAPIAFEDLDAMTEEFWATILATNLLGPYRCSRAAAASLKDNRGAIVNTASVAGLGRRGSSIAYSASKAGLINLTRSLARALAPDVRVNAVAPGLVATPWTEPWPEARKAATVQHTMLRRMARPEDIAETIFFLAAGAAYITGETITVDGGAL